LNALRYGELNAPVSGDLSAYDKRPLA